MDGDRFAAVVVLKSRIQAEGRSGLSNRCVENPASVSRRWGGRDLRRFVSSTLVVHPQFSPASVFILSLNGLRYSPGRSIRSQGLCYSILRDKVSLNDSCLITITFPSWSH